MPRGGKRQGTPGKAFTNRTDLAQNYMPAADSNTAATGGQLAPPPQMPQASPEDSPMLTDPTARPNEPITSGLPSGPGPGPEAIDPRLQETQQLKKWLPLLEPMLNQEDTPQSVKALVTYIRGS
jgi:hypothetical protein